MTEILHRLGTWSYKNSEELSGFFSASVVTTSITGFAVTLIQTAILALVSGALGALGGHLIKKILTKKPKQNETN